MRVTEEETEQSANGRLRDVCDAFTSTFVWHVTSQSDPLWLVVDVTSTAMYWGIN
jgi:hypothetical protein